MRAICHILRVVGYMSLVPHLAHVMRARFRTCEFLPIGLIDYLVPFVTFIFVLGYGQSLRMKKPWDSPVTFWAANVIFHAGLSALVIWRNHDGLFAFSRGSLSRFQRAFLPEYRPHQVLDALGELSGVIVTVWMPVAALLSMIALIIVLRRNGANDINSNNGSERAKIAGAGDQTTIRTQPR